MDCEKFESNLIDELYGELDDVTSAAMKRHAAGCSRCSALLGGLRATRKVAALPLEEAPAGLEDRILAAAREAQKVVPMRSRFSQIVSRAGAWAMRPQTAMAAVFLLAIGSSVVLMNNRSQQSSPVGVSVQSKGAPMDVPAAAAASANAESAGDYGAHGTLDPAAHARAQATTAAGLEEKDKANDDSRSELEKLAVGNAAPPAGLADTTTTLDGLGRGSAGASGYWSGSGGQGGFDPQQQAYGGSGGGTAFESGMGDYRARRFDEATRRFDTLSTTDLNAALWAARSVRESSGCGAAVGRFDQVAARAVDTPIGYEAMLDAGRCYKQLGNYDAARARFAKLAGVPTYAARAQTELDSMSPSTTPRAAMKNAPAPIKPMATATATAPATGTGAKPTSADAL